uniref:Uncharacterized protein n=1 Tax=Anguilla anguilla TaxID=7936 RepID=A0A0E9TAQ3_ANGAN
MLTRLFIVFIFSFINRHGGRSSQYESQHNPE